MSSVSAVIPKRIAGQKTSHNCRDRNRAGSHSFNTPGNDVVKGSRSLPATCPPVPEMPAHKLNAVSGVGRRVPTFGVYAVIGDGRRVASSGKAGGHLFVIFSAFSLNNTSPSVNQLIV